jgi:hypothetical protein
VKQASIGTEPVEIARATEALGHFAPRHPILAKLEARIRQAHEGATLSPQ